jgi:TolB-like protein
MTCTDCYKKNNYQTTNPNVKNTVAEDSIGNKIYTELSKLVNRFNIIEQNSSTAQNNQKIEIKQDFHK